MLTHNAYGKSAVRLTKVTRLGELHELHEFDVQIELEGAFAASYTAGDNRQVIATDSMKNTVYVLAREQEFDSCEAFALLLARHFVKTYSQVSQATVRIAEASWRRIELDGKPHPHSFVSGGNEQRTCSVVAARSGPTTVTGGVSDLVVLKTTDSAFKDFVSDRYRTLPDAEDRIFATSVIAEWEYADVDADWNGTFAAARAAILSTFATHYSLAVQQTLLEMGGAVLAACPSVMRVTFSLPNQHRIPVNLGPFGLDNPNVVFVPTSEPFGLIKGTIERDTTQREPAR